jgi:hypothetical protein
MTLAPQYIVSFHRTLLSAIGVDYFPPGLGDVNLWESFLFVMKLLADSAGGAFTEKDIVGAVRLMREQNRNGTAKWSLRFAKIMNDPEAFRDLVLLARKTKRPVAQLSKLRSVKTPDGSNVQVEHDPSAGNEPRTIAHELRKWRQTQKQSQAT